MCDCLVLYQSSKVVLLDCKGDSCSSTKHCLHAPDPKVVLRLIEPDWVDLEGRRLSEEESLHLNYLIQRGDYQSLDTILLAIVNSGSFQRP